MTTYPFVPSYYDDLGARKGPTLGLMIHMAEGGGTVGYLDKNGDPPARRVSVHAVCEYTGRVVQMLKWGDASGSLNPADRSTDKAYFGHQHLVDVLGDWWPDPNSAVISMEIEGFAVAGPNQKQVAAAIAWGLDMRGRYPSIRGALGHADQTDTKRCPGATPPMRAIFTGLGGHGLFTEEPMGLQFRITERVTGVATVTGAGHALIRVDNGAHVGIPDGQQREVAAKITLTQPTTYKATTFPAGTTGYLVGNIVGATPDNSIGAMLLTKDGTFVAAPLPAPLPPDAVSCKPYSDAAVATLRAAIKVEETAHAAKVGAL